MPTSPSRVHRMLLEIARGRLGPLPADGDPVWERLAAAAGAHGVQGWVALALRGAAGVPKGFQVGLQATALRIAGNHHRMLRETAGAVALLDAAGVPAVVFKGPALVERYYDDHRLRSYGDVDLLVRPRDFEAAVAALTRGGYALADRNWEFLVDDLRGQVHLTSPAGAVVELHWHLVNGSRQRRALGMGPEEMWDAVEAARLGDASCLVFARPDELAHLALHAAMHGCNRLVWLLDVAAVCAAPGLDWDRVAARLRGWRFGTGGGLVLSLAAHWAGASVPAEVTRDLVGRPTRAAARRVVERWDLGAPGEASQARGLFFATAADDATTRARLAVDAVVPAPGQQPESRDGPLYRATVGAFRRVRGKVFAHDRGDALVEYVAVGDPAEGRRRFLDAVAATAPDDGDRRVVVVSPSSSVGMSHYTDALARAIEGAAHVEVVDAARGDEPASLVASWRRSTSAERERTRVLVTSPHWSTPVLLRATGWGGGFVWHDPILDAATTLTKPLHELYYRLLTKRLRVVVLHGSVFEHRVRDLGLPARTTLVVPHGFVPEQLVADEPYDPAGPLLFAGRLHPYKGLTVLLAALSILPPADAPPVVVGGAGVTRDLVPASLGSVEVRPGEIPDAELRALFAACSAVLLPYERANQSGVLATAFRSGRPVIASRVGSFAEYVRDGHNGLLVPPGDPRALAAAMTRLRDDAGLARRLAAGARQTWEEELSPERWGRAIVDALFR
ncbi:MAG TPA: nucleotidyltransferase family protein [Actinomycetota bacterium]|nr:nucleotidyltransferase family protein [Actinomycetota bacterium]